MKLYAVVIGRKNRNTLYVAYRPKIHLTSTNVLAVYETRKEARRVRIRMLVGCGHKDIHVITFDSGD